ncbi:MAG: asparaginase [Planctomycetota bacterium]
MPSDFIALLAAGGAIAHGPAGVLHARSLIRLAASSKHGIPSETPVRGTDIEYADDLCATTESIERLAATIRDTAAEAGCVGVVVTHSLETLEPVAFACDLLIGAIDKPVIFTGAFTPPHAKRSDAHANLSAAVRAAGSRTTPRLSGVFIVVNDRIHAAIEATRIRAHSSETFASPAVGPVGICTEGRVQVLRAAARIEIDTHAMDPRVELIDCRGIECDDAIRAASSRARGIVLQTAGSGTMRLGDGHALHEAIAAGVLVMMSHESCLRGADTGTGGISQRVVPAVYDPDGPRPTTIDGRKAATLLMAAIGAGLDRARLRRVLRQRPDEPG